MSVQIIKQKSKIIYFGGSGGDLNVVEFFIDVFISGGRLGDKHDEL
jgi:hypothetical protein